MLLATETWSKTVTINRLLLLDAITCALMGVALVSAAPHLSPLFELPQGLIYSAGLLLLPIALFMAVLSRQVRPAAAGLWLVILGNAAWVVASLAVLAFTSPSALGTGFILLQAAVVAALAWGELQLRPHSSMSAG
jgi:hypothetical protein